jgi:hypothetical protein
MKKSGSPVLSTSVNSVTSSLMAPSSLSLSPAGNSPLPTTRFHLAGCSTAATIRGDHEEPLSPEPKSYQSRPARAAMNVRPRPYEAALGRDNRAWRSPASPKRWCGRRTGDCGYNAPFPSRSRAAGAATVASNRPAPPGAIPNDAVLLPLRVPSWLRGQPLEARGAGTRNETPQPIAEGAGVSPIQFANSAKARCYYPPQPRLARSRRGPQKRTPDEAPVRISEGGRGVVPRDQQAPVDCLVRFPWDPPAGGYPLRAAPGAPSPSAPHIGPGGELRTMPELNEQQSQRGSRRTPSAKTSAA